MKFITYLDEKKDTPGVLSKDGSHIYAFSDLGLPYRSLLELIADYTPEVQKSILTKIQSSAQGIPLEKVSLTAPIPHLRHDVICLGQNYLAHAMEYTSFENKEYVPPEFPTYFSKRTSRVTGHLEPVLSHADISSMCDYEVELAVIIGKDCDKVSREKVYDFVFGYTIINDFTARDLQKNHGGQFYFGKSLDGFTAMGPCIVTRDEFCNPPELKICSRVNGETRQDSNTSDFIFDIAFVISELSQGIVLKAGDIIATGTPAGVGIGFNPPKFLRAGDVVECEIEGIGILRNPIQN